MNSFEYEEMLESYPDTAIVFGDSAMTQFEAKLLIDGSKSALFFLGGAGSAERSGAWQALLKATSSFEVEVLRHAGIPPEPDIECVESMVAALEQAKPELVVAIGGGSVMDAAKAAYAAWQTGLPLQELFGRSQITAKFPGRTFKRVICFPTTSGTGSEATPYSNIVDRKRGVKMIISDTAILPELAFVEPSFTLSAPPGLTRQVALDALTHSIEGFLNITAANPHPDSDKWALESIRLIVKALPKALLNPESLQAREQLSAAATLGGMVIRYKSTSLPHLCSYSFFDVVPHGIVVSSLLTHFWRLYLENPDIRERTMLLAGIFPGAEQSTPENVIDAYQAFLVACGAPKSLGELPGCDDALIKRVASSAKENPVKLESCPRPISLAESEDVLSRVLQKAFKA